MPQAVPADEADRGVAPKNKLSGISQSMDKRSWRPPRIRTRERAAAAPRQRPKPASRRGIPIAHHRDGRREQYQQQGVAAQAHAVQRGTVLGRAAAARWPACWSFQHGFRASTRRCGTVIGSTSLTSSGATKLPPRSPAAIRAARSTASTPRVDNPSSGAHAARGLRYIEHILQQFGRHIDLVHAGSRASNEDSDAAPGWVPAPQRRPPHIASESPAHPRAADRSCRYGA